jgi:hypothetical protein
MTEYFRNPFYPYIYAGAVSLFMSFTVFFASCGLLSAIACCLLELAMIHATRRKMEGWTTFTFSGRDIGVIFQRHRRLYPESRVRAAFVLSSCVLGICIGALIAIQRIANGIM